MKKDKDVKAVRIELINEHRSPYRVLKKMMKYHGDIAHAKVGLAWVKRLKPDKDGHLILGSCHKSTELERDLKHYDFIILLNKEVWRDDKFGDKRRKALMDHELCHAAPIYAKSGKPKKDDKGRFVFRSRHHDLEEFRDIVKRHGMWKDDIVRFAEALLKNRRKK